MQQVQLGVRPMLAIVDTTKGMLVALAALHLTLGAEAWCRTQRAWVLRLQQREAHRVPLVKRLAGVRCEVAPVKWTQPRRQVWLLVRRW